MLNILYRQKNSTYYMSHLQELLHHGNPCHKASGAPFLCWCLWRSSVIQVVVVLGTWKEKCLDFLLSESPAPAYLCHHPHTSPWKNRPRKQGRRAGTPVRVRAYLLASRGTTGPAEYTPWWILPVVPRAPTTFDPLVPKLYFPKWPQTCGCGVDYSNLHTFTQAGTSDIKIST